MLYWSKFQPLSFSPFKLYLWKNLKWHNWVALYLMGQSCSELFICLNSPGPPAGSLCLLPATEWSVALTGTGRSRAGMERKQQRSWKVKNEAPLLINLSEELGSSLRKSSRMEKRGKKTIGCMRGTSSKLWKGERKGPKFREVEERVLVCCHRKLIENVKNWIPRIEQSYHCCCC